MIFPNKFINFEESIINKMIYILDRKDKSRINLNKLYLELESKFDNIDEFIYSIDLLYILEYINIENEDLIYVDRN